MERKLLTLVMLTAFAGNVVARGEVRTDRTDRRIERRDDRRDRRVVASTGSKKTGLAAALRDKIKRAAAQSPGEGNGSGSNPSVDLVREYQDTMAFENWLDAENSKGFLTKLSDKLAYWLFIAKYSAVSSPWYNITEGNEDCDGFKATVANMFNNVKANKADAAKLTASATVATAAAVGAGVLAYKGIQKAIALYNTKKKAAQEAAKLAKKKEAKKVARQKAAAARRRKVARRRRK